MHNFRELIIWQQSKELVKEVYLVTKKLPPDELYGLTSQIRHAVVPISTNIAEGCGRQSDKELSRFLGIANGSAFELESLLLLACDLNYISLNEIEKTISEITEIEKMIYSFKLKLEKLSK